VHLPLGVSDSPRACRTGGETAPDAEEPDSLARTEAAVSGVSRKVAQQQSTRRWESALLNLLPIEDRHLNDVCCALDLPTPAEAALVQAEVADIREAAADAGQVSPARSGFKTPTVDVYTALAGAYGYSGLMEEALSTG
jgi:hypothetical protein